MFGNLLVKEDSLPLKILPRLKKEFREIEFVEFNTVEDLEKEGPDLIIIDTVEGTNDVSLITDINSIKIKNIFSLHDFDLAYNLKLMKKIGMLNSVKIFAIPKNMNEEEAFKKLKKLIKSTLF